MPRQRLREIAEASQTDPKQALLDSLGDVVDIEIFHNKVLVATYIGPEKTPGGIIRPDKSILEDRFQSKVGLVIKLGPLAFQDDAIAKFGGKTIKEGDWVIAYPSDGRELFSVDVRDGATSCRLFADTQIQGRVPDPSIIW
jgi:co-chaperonin GroES (HSP10)